ncbi:MAG: hypothetical protein U5L08_06515 [Xanthomonadales bacterium]|nr:hypothetical protein [Xanthomonadales bacterium]
MKKPSPDMQELLAVQGGCGRMLAISEDFHKLLRESCQKCADGAPCVCMAQRAASPRRPRPRRARARRRLDPAAAGLTAVH